MICYKNICIFAVLQILYHANFSCHKFFWFDKFYKPPACKRLTVQKVITMTPSKLHKIMSFSQIKKTRCTFFFSITILQTTIVLPHVSEIWREKNCGGFRLISIVNFFFIESTLFMCVNSAIAFHWYFDIGFGWFSMPMKKNDCRSFTVLSSERTVFNNKKKWIYCLLSATWMISTTKKRVLN